MNAEPIPPRCLDYSPTGGGRRRRRYGAAAVLLFLVGLAAVGRHYQPRLARHLALRAAINDCMSWRPPANLPVYEDDPDAVRKLAASPGTYAQAIDGVELRVPPMERLQDLITLGGRGFDVNPPLFTQTLRLGGERRIVAVCDSHQFIGDEYVANAYTGVVVAPGRWYEAPRLSKSATGPIDRTMPAEMQPSYSSITLVIPKGAGHLRIDAGAVDPSDPASALYPYTFAGRRGQIRLRLLADETVELSPESGPLKEVSDKLSRGPSASDAPQK